MPTIDHATSRRLSRSKVARLAAVSLVALTVAACSDSGVQETADAAPATPAIEAPSETTTMPAPAVTTAAPAGVDPVTTASVEVPQASGDVDMEAVLEPGPLPEMVMGEADAPVTIVEYMSLTCPHCATFHNDTFAALKEKYIDSGQVRFIARDFPFDPRAAAGAMLARCAPEGQYYPMISVLFQQQNSWATAQDARGALMQISRMAGFTQESFEACLTNQQLLDDVNAVRTKAAEEFGVQSTPTFLINGKRYAGTMSIDQMSAIIDSML